MCVGATKRRRLAIRLRLNLRAEGGEQFAEIGAEGGPTGCCDQVAVDERIGHREADEGATAEGYLGACGWIGVALFAIEHTSDGKNLRSMADCRKRLIGLGKVMDDFDDAGIEAEVLRRAPAWDHERVIRFGFDLIEGGVELEIVAALFGVGLIAFEIVDRSGDKFASFLSRADHVNRVADHLKRVERNHHFEDFSVIARDHENQFLGHEPSAEEL
jgi:hypothetical protein